MDQSITFNQLEDGLPGLTKSWGGLLAEAGMVCFQHQSRHPRGVVLTVKGTASAKLHVYWESEITEQILAAWDNEDETIEFAACAIAILLILKLTPYTIVRRARKGEGVDYWLSDKNAEYPFQETARLEVSGILKGSPGMIKARVTQKKNQTRPTDGATPAYIIVVEFSKPVSHMEQK